MMDRSEAIALLRRLAAANACVTEMATEAGLSRHSVRRICREARIAIAPVHLRMARGREKGIEASRAYSRVRIPRWVPRDLRDDYRDFAAEMGEEVAASRVRRLKAEARA
ncbi:hypothetical protein [Xanthobacter sp. KR7-225]|uniref:hypothetical protein n=1 Tax=Xanthobacter sp. KR7-225 TaxID=3156613 RepID=UPI0032B49743